jgi:hypothetical protein
VSLGDYEHLASSLVDAEDAAGGFGFGAYPTVTPIVCFLD